MRTATRYQTPKLSWRRDLVQRLTHLWPLKAAGTSLFMLLFFQGYFFVLANPIGEVLVMPRIWLDHWVPFVPQALAIYVSLWVYVSLPPALLGSFMALVRYGLWVGLMCLVCLAIFWVFPTQVPEVSIDWSGYPVLALLKGVDAAGNACPSLHVASAVFTACWLQRLGAAMHVPRWLIWGSHLCCLAIAWSTLAILQHVALDAMAGALVGGVFAWLSLVRSGPSMMTPVTGRRPARA